MLIATDANAAIISNVAFPLCCIAGTKTVDAYVNAAPPIAIAAPRPIDAQSITFPQ
jgi:hypothetical protein